MKKTFLALIALGSLQLVNAQMKEGKVVYEGVTQFNFKMMGGGPELKDLPKSQTKQYELLFGNNQSLWQPLPDIKEAANQMNPSPGGGPMINFVSIGGADAVVYHNFDESKRISERELGGKNYIVEEDINKLDWKLTDETKTILGHKVFKAKAERISTRTVMMMENGETSRKQMPDTSRMVAWFAADIPVPAGPDYQGQLPGLIMQLDVNNGRTVFTAIELSPKVNVASIKQPKNGKKVSGEVFAKEQAKAMEQMQQNRLVRPGDGQRISITTQQ